MPLDDRVIAISATFTAEAIEPGLSFWVKELRFDYEIRFAGYNQLFQELLDPAGLFARNRGINVALVRFDERLPAEYAHRLADAVRAAAVKFAAPLIVAICPEPPKRLDTSDLAEEEAGPGGPARTRASAPRFLKSVETAGRSACATLREEIADLAAVHVLTAEEVLSLYPVDDVHDPHSDELGHVPYTPLFFVALATAVARRIHAIVTPPFKAIALDCDETLWAGICGEDGPGNVVVDEPRRALQEFMAERRRSGVLLAVCSKNNEEDVVETFLAHPGMPLRLEDFVSRRINWESKGANLVSLADELELGLDSFILVDDSPKECSEAELGAPGVLALALPPEPAEIPEFLRHVWAFDQARVTEEDRRRPELYAQLAARVHAERTAPSLEAFLASLELEVTIARMEPGQVARVAQLTQRTNQMNVTGVRRSEAELQALDGAECLTVKVQDRFGSYGLTGVMILRAEGAALVVDTFLLSCRALGRGVEHRMMARLGEIAVARGLDRVEIRFVPSQRNRPAALFLESLATADADGVLRLRSADAAAVRYRVGQPVAIAAESPAPSKGPVRRIDYARIANQLREPAAILERLRAATRRAVPRRARFDPPRTPLERELAELWASLLNLPAVGVRDNFFELGGHSLLAVQLLSQVRQIYGVDLSLEVVYSGEFTVEALAKAVELKEIELGGADYQDLLQELEGLSDEEVRALLAEEQE